MAACDICGQDPCHSPTFCDACREADRRRDADDPPVKLDDFLAYSPDHKYIYKPNGKLWPAATVNGRLPWIGGRKPSSLLDSTQAVEDMTWAPGEPLLIRHKLVVEGGWIEHHNATVFNLYRPPNIELGNPKNAGPWIGHVHKVYPGDAEHIIKWLACRVQFPEVKINHALVLGGSQGIGKDTLLAPVRIAVGHWNVQSVSPQELLGRFNGFRKSVILLVSEARDLGDVNRPQFYEHLKATIAAPPDVLRVDEKNRHEYYVPNVVGVILTTNYKAGGIYLAAEDRRHFVAWSDLELEDFHRSYWDHIWGYYDDGGYADVAAFLHDYDLSGFDAKAPPPKTAAFWEIVNASRAPENAELDTALTEMGRPVITTLDRVVAQASMGNGDFASHLKDRRNRRMIPRWMEQCRYTIVNNPDAKNGLWNYDGAKRMVYGNLDYSHTAHVQAIRGER